MKLLSATDLAIAVAIKNNTLNLEPFKTRFGGFAISIGDDHGTIEIAMDWAECDKRIDAIRTAIA